MAEFTQVNICHLLDANPPTGTVTVRVRGRLRLKVRLWIATRLIRLAGWLVPLDLTWEYEGDG